LYVAVFSTPGSPGLDRIMRMARDQGWGASLFLKSPEPGNPPPRTGILDLLFVSQEPRGGAPVGSRERFALQEALARDLAAYHGTSAQVMHAAEI
jgi:hypothetical protein